VTAAAGVLSVAGIVMLVASSRRSLRVCEPAGGGSWKLASTEESRADERRSKGRVKFAAPRLEARESN